MHTHMEEANVQCKGNHPLTKVASSIPTATSKKVFTIKALAFKELKNKHRDKMLLEHQPKEFLTKFAEELQ